MARYMNDLAVKKENLEQDKKAQKRKAEVDKLSDMQNDCKRLKTDIAQLTENAKRCKTRVIRHGLLLLRRSAGEKQKEIDKLLRH